MGTLLLDVGGGDNLGGEVEPLAQVVKTLGGEGVVVVLPGELGLDVAAGVQRLAGLDDLGEIVSARLLWDVVVEVASYIEVLGVDVTVLGKVEVLLGHEHTLCVRKSVQLLDYVSVMLCAAMLEGLDGLGGGEGASHIPRKRYSWIFLRSSLGISLDNCQRRNNLQQRSVISYIVASSWRNSGNRFDNARKIWVI